MTLAQFIQFPFIAFMAAEHQKVAFPFLCRTIGKNQNIPAIFLAFYYYRAKGKFNYFSHEIWPSLPQTFSYSVNQVYVYHSVVLRGHT
jgi:hypothetical protein